MFVNSLEIYKIIFMAELLLVSLLFTSSLKKKSHFVFRYLGLSAVCMLAAVFFPVPTYTAAYTSFLFLVLFVLMSIGLLFCYQEPVLNILHCAITSYIVRHLAFQIFSMYITFVQGGNQSISSIYGQASQDTVFDSSFFFSLFSYLACYFIVCTLCYTIFGLRIAKNGSLEIKKPSFIILAVLILFIDILLNAVSVYNSVDDYVLNDAVLYINVVTLYLYNIISTLFALFLQFSILETDKMKKEVELVNYLWQKEKEEYDLTKEKIDLINMKCHDLKHQVRHIAEGSLDVSEIKELEKNISIYDSVVTTGNEVLDIILTEKSLICNQEGIKLSILAGADVLSFMNKSDLYVFFGNLFDNALEAVRKIEDKEKRVISINIRVEDKIQTMSLSNYFEGKVILGKNGLPVTTKGDTNYHGYGMKSVSLIVEKYNGDIEFSTENNIFTVSILFPVKEIDKDKIR